MAILTKNSYSRFQTIEVPGACHSHALYSIDLTGHCTSAFLVHSQLIVVVDLNGSPFAYGLEDDLGLDLIGSCNNCSK